MKIVEQYVAAVGSKLPWRTRKDIVDELRSALMDQIEATYGQGPTEEQAITILEKFGSPSKVAAGYRSEKPVISSGFADLFFLITGIMGGAMLVGFGTVFVVQSLLEPIHGAELAEGIGKVVLDAFRAWLSGIGAVTIVFVLLSRLFPNRSVDLEEDWTPADLKGVPVDGGAEPRAESIATIAFLSALLVLMNLYPGVVNLAEELFARSGLPLGHRIVVDVFRNYIVVLSLLWAARIALAALMLHRGGSSRAIRSAVFGVSAAEIALLAVMLADPNLYSESGGWIGFKVIFAIVLVVMAAEALAGLVRIVRDRIVGGKRRNAGGTRR